jgi:hypothetical protein
VKKEFEWTNDEETMWLDQAESFMGDNEEPFQLRIDLIDGKPRYLVTAAIVEGDSATCEKEKYQSREISAEVWRDLATLQSINETRRLRHGLYEALNSGCDKTIGAYLAQIAEKS